MVHQGQLESQSTAEVRFVTWKDRTLASVAVPAETPSLVILRGLPLLSLVEKSGAHPGDVEEAAIAIERRWSAEGLNGREILETLAEVYVLLSDMVLEAHTLLKCFSCIPEESGHPDFCSSYHRTGTLECMVMGVEQRTQRYKLSTLDELIPATPPRRRPRASFWQRQNAMDPTRTGGWRLGRCRTQPQSPKMFYIGRNEFFAGIDATTG